MEALRQRQDRERFIRVRGEEATALMACGYAKCTWRLHVGGSSTRDGAKTAGKGSVVNGDNL